MVERLRLGEGGPVRIQLPCSAFNGLRQRAWLELRAAGYHVVAQSGDDAVRAAVAVADPDLVICPFVRERIPADVCRALKEIDYSRAGTPS